MSSVYGSPPPVPSPNPVPAENGARTVCALLLVLAVFGIIYVGFTIGDKSSNASSDPQVGVGGQQSVQGGAGAGGSGPGSATGSSVPTSVTRAQLRRHFPLPPGAHRTRAKDLYLPPNEKAYVVRSRLGPVKQFYAAQFTKLGLESDSTHGVTRRGGRIVGYTLPFYGSGNDPVSGLVSLDENYLGNTPGVITIEVEVD